MIKYHTQKDIKEIFNEQKEKGRIDEATDFPSVLLIDTVGFCNFSCVMCPFKSMNRANGYMPWSLFTKIIDEIALKKPEARVWMVFVGEPFIASKRSPSIFEMIRYAKSKGLQDVVLNTNGYLMDEDVSKEMISAGLDGIYIGVDAANKTSYEKIRINGSYDKLVENINNLIKLKKSMNQSNPEVFVQMVELEENIGEVDQFIANWKDQDVNIKIRPKASWGGAIESQSEIYDNEDRFQCRYLMNNMAIYNDGTVPICPIDFDGNVECGTVVEESIESVWKSKLAVLRQNHINGEWNKLPEFCYNCKDWQIVRAEFVMKDKHD